MNRNDRLLTAALLLIKFTLPFVLCHPDFGLHRDEYLYYAQGQHLAAGYLENPPLIGLLGRLSALMGGGFFWIRFWPSLFGTLTLWIALLLTRGFGGGRYAQLLTAVAIIGSAFLRVHFLFQPNFLDIFFWTAASLFLQRYLLHQRTRDLQLLALTLALGWWGKYSVLFYIAALFIGILLTQRQWLARPAFWKTAAVGFVITLPNLWWQWQHNWPLVHHMSELRDTQLRYLSRADFLKEQVLMFLPSFVLVAGGLIWLLREPRFRIFGILYIGVLALLMLGSGKGYYALGIYPMILAAGAAWMEMLLRRSLALRALVLLAIQALALPMFFLLLPLQAPEAMAQFNQRWGFGKMGILRWEDQREHALQQDFADMIGWQEIAKKTYDYYDALPSPIQDSTVIYARNYGYAGSLLYHVKDTGFRRKLICDNGSFLLWIPDRLPYRHLLFVGEEAPQKGDAVFEHFARIEKVDSCTNSLSRQYGTQILFFADADTAAFPLAERGLEEMKARFRRKK